MQIGKCLRFSGEAVALRSEVYGRSTPGFRVDVGEGLGEIPVMAVEVLGVVLAFAVDMIFGLGEDPGSVAAGALAVGEGSFDADLRDGRAVRDDIAFGNGEASFSSAHLDAVVS